MRRCWRRSSPIAGGLTWRTRGGQATAELGVPQAKEVTAAAWRTALDPAGAWVTSVLKSADRRLSEMRRNIPELRSGDRLRPRVGPRDAARLRELTGQQPVVVLSDDPRASERIESFAASGSGG